MSEEKKLFTSESVSEGHPDKVADQISDAVVDACFRDDPESRVACEVLTTTGIVFISGEISTHTYVDFQKVARGVARKIGYTRAEFGLDYESMSVITSVHEQSADIAQGVDGKGLYEGEQGAGDQGMMFGFACRETPELMPAPITYSHQILRHAADLRKGGVIPWLRPDSKSQVTVEYDGYTPKRIEAVVVSHQHDEDVSYEEIREQVISQIIKPVLEPTGLIDNDTIYYVNPTGRFVRGGPHGDTGLTGRKIIVDTYGGMGRHGGGAFSGKDPSKVDRSAAYMARYVAKNIVAAELCDRCEIEIAYAIGVPQPISVSVDSFGTAKVSEDQLAKAIRTVFDLRPAAIIKTLDLKRPIYQETASYGHFGRDGFSWEKTDQVEALQKVIS
ncbi:MAG: methionine adenosyltransferase [Spirochaetales bacterium]|jgi:S-adenosylmethionine synthetase|nr:methionine adenosyltransferase [Spirochaetales bacterium]